MVAAECLHVWVGELTLVCCSGCIEHDEYADDTDQGADKVIAVGFEMIYFPSPKEGQDDKDASVGGIDPAKAGGLVGGYDPVKDQEDGAADAVPDGTVLFEPKPDKIAAADLAEAGEKEQGQGFEDGHSV